MAKIFNVDWPFSRRIPDDDFAILDENLDVLGCTGRRLLVSVIHGGPEWHKTWKYTYEATVCFIWDYCIVYLDIFVPFFMNSNEFLTFVLNQTDSSQIPKPQGEIHNFDRKIVNRNCENLSRVFRNDSSSKIVDSITKILQLSSWISSTCSEK